MIAVIKRYFSSLRHGVVGSGRDDFSDFFYNASKSDKETLMRDVMREATESQLSTIKRAREIGCK